MYIYDLPLKLNASVASMYADDTSISFSSSSNSTINNVVNEDLESLTTCLEENKLSLNVAKTHCILIGSRNKIRALNQPNTITPSNYIGDDKVSPMPSIKYLGVQDQYLNWEKHLLIIKKFLVESECFVQLHVTSHWKLYKMCTEVQLSVF